LKLDEEEQEFTIVPKNTKYAIQSEMQVVSSERIEDSDLYNVTVNMVLKKGGPKKESKPPTKSLELLAVVEQPEETVAVPPKFAEETIAAPLKEIVVAPIKLA